MSNQENASVDLSQLAAQAIQQQQLQQELQNPPAVDPTPDAVTQAPTQPILPPINQQPATGIILNNSDLTDSSEHKPPTADEVNHEVMDNIDEYLKGMDEDFESAAEMREKLDPVNPNAQAVENLKVKNDIEPEIKEGTKEGKDEEDDEDELSSEELSEQIHKEFSEAIVVIDKIGMGRVHFTDEEHEKLQLSKKITLQEIETVDIRQFRAKRPKKVNLDKILKRQNNIHETPIVLPASGYTATLQGVSTYELISLMGGGEDILIEAEAKWTTIHSKIKDSSLGNMNFNDFLRATAASDYNMFIFGILCATYPDDDRLPINCANAKCGKVFDHNYSVRSLIRAEQMSDKLHDLVIKTTEASHTEEDAKAVHAEAPINVVKNIKLPMSGYVFEITTQNAYSLLYDSIKTLAESEEEKYAQAAILATVVNRVFIEDEDRPGEAFEFVEVMDIVKIIYSLQAKDILVLSKQSEDIIDDNSIEFGLMDVKCPHCGDYRQTVPFDIESILFYQYQQSLNTTIE